MSVTEVKTTLDDRGNSGELVVVTVDQEGVRLVNTLADGQAGEIFVPHQLWRILVDTVSQSKHDIEGSAGVF